MLEVIGVFDTTVIPDAFAGIASQLSNIDVIAKIPKIRCTIQLYTMASVT